jgi:hypothetical protein
MKQWKADENQETSKPIISLLCDSFSKKLQALEKSLILMAQNHSHRGQTNEHQRYLDETDNTYSTF